jgi:hypothetical protein
VRGDSGNALCLGQTSLALGKLELSQLLVQLSSALVHPSCLVMHLPGPLVGPLPYCCLVAFDRGGYCPHGHNVAFDRVVVKTASGSSRSAHLAPNRGIWP